MSTTDLAPEGGNHSLETFWTVTQPKIEHATTQFVIALDFYALGRTLNFTAPDHDSQFFIEDYWKEVGKQLVPEHQFGSTASQAFLMKLGNIANAFDRIIEISPRMTQEEFPPHTAFRYSIDSLVYFLSTINELKNAYQDNFLKDIQERMIESIFGKLNVEGKHANLSNKLENLVEQIFDPGVTTPQNN